MKRLAPLALAVLLALPSAVHAASSVNIPGWTSPQVDDGLAAGLDMMLVNTSLLRNGDNVWQRAREGFQLSEVNPELVRRHEKYFSSRPEYLRRTLDRSRKYLFHIMNEVEKRGMPTELAFLPLVESSFAPYARSPVGAEGLWQFMPNTGRDYALEQTWWYDGRRDVVESTRAALDYLQTLHGRFGDWNLALAAYNWGQGNLSRAITKVRARGETETYENITMPAETRNYAPKLLAIRNIMAQPENFGMRIDVLPNKPAFVAISTGKHMNIDVAAKLAEIPVAEFRELNPAFNLPVYAHKNGRQMLLPAAKLHRFETNLAKWDKPLLTWQVHVPTSEESISDLARQYDMNPNELLAANRLQVRTVNAGQPILVASKNQNTNDSLNSSEPLEAIDTPLVNSAAVLVASNDSNTAALKPSVTVTPAVATPVISATIAPAVSSRPAVANPAPAETIKVAEAIAPTPKAIIKPVAQQEPPALVKASTAPALPQPAGPIELHIVASSDTLYNISRRYGMGVDELKRLNNLTTDTVKLGQSLRIHNNASGSTAVAQSTDNNTPVSPLRTVAYQPSPRAAEYIVQTGDTVYSIARKLGIDQRDIQRWNDQLLRQQIRPGQVLRVDNSGL